MKIGNVSEATGLGIHTIRYYEKLGLTRRPERDVSGHRDYDANDVDLLNWVACMKNAGMSLNKIKQYTCAFYADDKETCLAFLQEHLQQLQVQKADTEHYISVTEGKISRFKKSLT